MFTLRDLLHICKKEVVSLANDPFWGCLEAIINKIISHKLPPSARVWIQILLRTSYKTLHRIHRVALLSRLRIVRCPEHLDNKLLEAKQVTKESRIIILAENI